MSEFLGAKVRFWVFLALVCSTAAFIACSRPNGTSAAHEDSTPPPATVVNSDTGLITDGRTTAQYAADQKIETAHITALKKQHPWNCDFQWKVVPYILTDFGKISVLVPPGETGTTVGQEFQASDFPHGMIVADATGTCYVSEAALVSKKITITTGDVVNSFIVPMRQTKISETPATVDNPEVTAVFDLIKLGTDTNGNFINLYTHLQVGANTANEQVDFHEVLVKSTATPGSTGNVLKNYLGTFKIYKTQKTGTNFIAVDYDWSIYGAMPDGGIKGKLEKLDSKSILQGLNSDWRDAIMEFVINAQLKSK